MIEVYTEHPPGTVGYITGGMPRYFQFFDSLENTKVPTGTVLHRAHSCNPAKNCNTLLENMKGDWIWIQGDDHTWKPDLLLNLLDRNLDVVVPLVPRWGPPFLPVIYKDFPDPIQTYSWQELELLKDKECIPVAAAGSAGILIRKYVIDAMLEHYGEPVFRVGMTGKDELSEDLEFTHKVNQLGFSVQADLTSFMGHATSAIIEPYRMKDGRLAITANIHGGRLMAYTTESGEKYDIGINGNSPEC